MFKGCSTALVTPMSADGSIDHGGLEQLVEFQIANNIQAVLAVGTTGESPTLRWEEHNEVIDRTVALAKGRTLSIAGTGSNSTKETMEGSKHAAHIGADAVLLVDPYYNGPSSLEIRREYVEPVARAFPEVQIIPYIIPGRTGCMMQVEDLAILAHQYPNVAQVKEATGDLDNMAKTRRLCGDDFTILSGDDDKTVPMMKSEDIRAAGVISVMSNVIPGPIQRLTELLNAGQEAEADSLAEKLAPLFGIVGVATTEQSAYGPVECKARNPVPIKTLMNILGMPAGPVRQPLGKMTHAGAQTVLDAARQVHANDPTAFAPVAEFFGGGCGSASARRLAGRVRGVSIVLIEARAMTKIVICGVAGRMGQRLAHLILTADDLELCGGKERPDHEAVGRDIGEVVGARHLGPSGQRYAVGYRRTRSGRRLFYDPGGNSRRRGPLRGARGAHGGGNHGFYPGATCGIRADGSGHYLRICVEF